MGRHVANQSAESYLAEARVAYMEDWAELKQKVAAAKAEGEPYNAQLVSMSGNSITHALDRAYEVWALMRDRERENGN